MDLAETVSTAPDSLPELNAQPVVDKNEVEATVEFIEDTTTAIEVASSSPGDGDVKIVGKYSDLLVPHIKCFLQNIELFSYYDWFCLVPVLMLC